VPSQFAKVRSVRARHQALGRWLTASNFAWPKIKIILVCLAIASVIAVGAVGSLAHQDERASPALSIDRVTPPMTKTASAIADPAASNTNIAEARKMPDACHYIEFFFINRSCSKNFRRHASRTKHLVAVSVLAHSHVAAKSVMAKN
jgi:hypothetical protein